MNKRKLALLEKVSAAEIEAALGNRASHLFQTKSRLAEILEMDGYLKSREIRLSPPWPVTICGYELTEAGRLEYCLSCKDFNEEAP